MRQWLRSLFKLVLLAALGLGVAALTRALVGRVSQESGSPERMSSYDSWPEVPQAPGARNGDST
jgi:hypothetical protein